MLQSQPRMGRTPAARLRLRGLLVPDAQVAVATALDSAHVEVDVNQEVLPVNSSASWMAAICSGTGQIFRALKIACV